MRLPPARVNSRTTSHIRDDKGHLIVDKLPGEDAGLWRTIPEENEDHIYEGDTCCL